MDDEKIVEAGEVSQEETPSEEKPEGEEPQPQPLSEEAIKQLIADGVTEGLEPAREAGRREMQGTKDREVAAAQRRARFAEDSLQRVRGKYTELDPEAQQTLELEELRGQVGHYESQSAEETQRQQVMATVRDFEGNMTQFITGMKINPKEVDWGDRNSMNLTQRMDTILKSVSKIQEESAKAVEEKRSQETKDIEAKLRKDLGLDSVDTSATSGTGVDISKLSPKEKINLGLKEGKRRK